MQQRIILIAAVSRNNIIGRNNRLPWSVSSEQKFFKEITMNNWYIDSKCLQPTPTGSNKKHTLYTTPAPLNLQHPKDLPVLIMGRKTAESIIRKPLDVANIPCLLPNRITIVVSRSLPQHLFKDNDYVNSTPDYPETFCPFQTALTVADLRKIRSQSPAVNVTTNTSPPLLLQQLPQRTLIMNDLVSSLALAKSLSSTVFVCGGHDIYKECMESAVCTELVISRMHQDVDITTCYCGNDNVNTTANNGGCTIRENDSNTRSISSAHHDSTTVNTGTRHSDPNSSNTFSRPDAVVRSTSRLNTMGCGCDTFTYFPKISSAYQKCTTLLYNKWFDIEVYCRR
jgi:dihydrofolate reductase